MIWHIWISSGGFFRANGPFHAGGFRADDGKHRPQTDAVVDSGFTHFEGSELSGNRGVDKVI
jgi:hypothetical protein